MTRPNATTFDSGLVDGQGRPVAFRTAVRNGVIALLSRRFNAATGENDPNGVGLLKVHGGFLTTIGKLAGPLAAFGDEQSVNQIMSSLLGRAPAILVAVGDREVSRAGTSGVRDLAFLDVHLYFVNKHQRSLVARVEADVKSTGNPAADPAIAPDITADPGIDVMMELAEQLLIGAKVDTTGVIKRLELKRETVSFVVSTHVITEQRYVVQVARSIDHTRGMARLLTGINSVLHPPGADASSPASVSFETELAGSES